MSYKHITAFASLGFNKQANVGSWIDDKWNKGQQAVTGAYDSVSKGVDTAYNAAAGAGNYVRDGLAEAGNIAYNNIENNVVAPAVGAYDSVANGAREIKNGVGQIGAAAADSVRNTVMAPVNVALGARDGLVSGASKGLGGAVQGALDGGWNAGKQVGKNYASASRQFETGLNQAGIADTQSHGLTSLGATRTPGNGPGSAVPTPQAPPANPSVIGAPRAIPAPSPTGYGQPKAAPAANVVNNGHAASKWQQDQFRKMNGGAYDPNSSVDRQKMQGIAKSAFAWLEKEALAKGVSKGLKWFGGKLGQMGVSSRRKAMGDVVKQRANPENYHQYMEAATPGALPSPREAIGDLGGKRIAAGKKLKGGASSLDESKTAQNVINYGAGTIVGGAGLYGAHSMGHNSGRKEGVTEGFDNGMNLGLEGAKAMQPGDPGWMGRLGDLFTGTDQGPSTAAMRQSLMSDRDKMIAALIKG